jgi:subfamily B ATP-binding cassette protein MsbA
MSAADTSRTARRLFALLRPHAPTIAVAIVCMLMFAILNAVLPFIVISATGAVAEQTGGAPADERFDILRSLASQLGGIARRPMWFVVIIVLVYFSLKGVFSYLRSVLMEQVGKRVIRDLRDRLYGHSLGLSADFYTQSRTGDLISRTTNDVLIIEESLVNTFGDLVQQPLSVIGTVLVVFYLNWKLALIAIVAIPAILFPILAIGRRIRRRMRRVQAKLADLTSVLQETFTGIRVVKAFSMEPYETERFKHENSRLYRMSVRIIRHLHMIRPVVELLGGIMVATALMIGAGIFKMGLPAIIGFSAALVQMYDPAKKLGAVYNRIQMGLAAAERVFHVMDIKPTVVEKPDAAALPPIRERITYEHVSFAYEDEPVLHDVSVEVNRGNILAIVGPSGSGKTTLVNLLLRFYDPVEGTIRIDGTDLRDVTLASLREQIGLVTQDVVLFNDTVAGNIAYGKPGALRESIIEAARLANADQFIRALPKGYDTVIGERGIKLSGGQRQRLAIARALFRNPPILVLDEATSALDTESERLVQQAIDRVMQHRTVLVIAHRLSTVQHADTIVVLRDGRIVEQGAHPELIEANGLYRKLYEMQFAL